MTAHDLLSQPAQQLLNSLPPYDEKQVFALTAALRNQGASPELTAALLTQSRLRAKAQTKFGPAAQQMLFTANGLEQATRPVVAQRHAARFLAAGCRSIADITCGIGADALGFAQAGLHVLAVEIDTETAQTAEFNLTHFRDSALPCAPRRARRMTEGHDGAVPRTRQTPSTPRHSSTYSIASAIECEHSLRLAQSQEAASFRASENAERRISETEGLVEVVCGDGLVLARERAGELDGVFADPARRHRAQREKREQIFDPDAYLPPLSEVLALRQVIPAVGIKVAPVIPHEAVPSDCEAQWVSVDGDVVECALWFGPLALNGQRRTALLLRTGDFVDGQRISHAKVMTQGSPVELETGPVGEFIFEPDGAIIRAGLLAEAAQQLQAHQLDSSIAYLTGDALPPWFRDAKALPQPTGVPIATAYQVMDVMPFNVKQLKAYLKARSVGRVTIKKRGTAITPEQLRPQLALKGNNEATIILTRIGGKQSVLVVDPIANK